MTAREAKPDRYLVDRIGKPDPDASVYFVLDVVHDLTAREALAYLGNQYRRRNQRQLSQECFDLLDATLPAVTKIADERFPRKAGGTKKDIGRD